MPAVRYPSLTANDDLDASECQVVGLLVLAEVELVTLIHEVRLDDVVSIQDGLQTTMGRSQSHTHTERERERERERDSAPLMECA
jgi:hypothetical protein